MIAGIDDGNLGILNQPIPFPRFDIGAGIVRVDTLDTQGDDFPLQLDPRTVKGCGFLVGEFTIEPVQT